MAEPLSDYELAEMRLQPSWQITSHEIIARLLATIDERDEHLHTQEKINVGAITNLMVSATKRRAELSDATARIATLEAALGQTEHVVVLSDDWWAVEHLPECRRIPNGMTKCAVHEALAVFAEELFHEHRSGRFRLVGWDDDYPLLALAAPPEDQT